MKRILGLILIVALLATLFTGCFQRTPDEVQQHITQLEQQEKGLEFSIQQSQVRFQEYDTQIKEKEEKLNLLQHIEKGETPKYMLTLEVSQSHVSLDIGKHIKDSMNKFEFDIAVDKEIYDNQSVGSELVRKFRDGSFWTEGSWGDWVIKVTKKEIKYIK